MILKDRRQAGKLLAKKLAGREGRADLVLALPRGGVPVGREIAEVLNLPLGVWVARKLGAPYNPEFGFGAVAEGEGVIINEFDRKVLGISEAQLKNLMRQEQREIKRRAQIYRSGRRSPDVWRKTVFLVDDGLATGVTAQAAARGLRNLGAKKIILVVPVAAPDTLKNINSDFDDIVCLFAPENFYAVGQWYREFEQLSDQEVMNLLQ